MKKYLFKLLTADKFYSRYDENATPEEQHLQLQEMTANAKIKIPSVTVNYDTSTVIHVRYWIPVFYDENKQGRGYVGFVVEYPNGNLAAGAGMGVELFRRVLEDYLGEGIPMVDNAPNPPIEPECEHCGERTSYHYYEENEHGPAFAEFECHACGETKKAPLPRLNIDFLKFFFV